MLKIILIALFLSCGIAYSQEFYLIDVKNPEATQGWEPYNYGRELYFIANHIYFDTIIYCPADQSVFYACLNPTGMIYSDVYKILINIFGGKENSNDDYIPKYVRDDNELLLMTIKQDEAKIIRTWFSDDLALSCSLYIIRNKMTILFSPLSND